MSLAATLAAFRDMLSAATGRTVTLGPPRDGEAALFVWPWRVEESPHMRAAEPPVDRGAGRTASPAVLQIHVLVFARPTLTPDGLAMLDAARHAIAQTPVIATAEGQVQCVAQNPPADQLAGLMQAAAIELSLCLGVMLSSR